MNRTSLTLSLSWFGTVDATPPLLDVPGEEEDTIDHLSDILLDPSENLFTRCRAMATLRNLCINESLTWSPDEIIKRIVQELLQAHQSESTAFLRHQLILTLGQISHEEAIPYLLYQLQNESEHEIVRAAAAEVLADFTYESEVVVFMQGFKDDESRLVRECVSLALAKVEALQ